MTPLFANLADRLPSGAKLFRSRLAISEQSDILTQVQMILQQAPPYRPQMPTGPFMINELTNCGSLGWVSDRKGYRYEPVHPVSGDPWPPIPSMVRDCAVAAAAEAGYEFEPDACLINLYKADGRLSLHRDFDEADFSWPIVSFSFGNTAEFQLAGLHRTGPSITFPLHSGDIFVLAGESRVRYHGVRRIRPGTSPITHPVLPKGGRINLTLRRAR